MSQKTLPGINIQHPVTDWIFSGKKTIETRLYPIPAHLIGRPVAVIETPGKRGNFKARVAGLVIFGKSFPYRSKDEFYRDSERHCVTADLKEYSWEAAGGKIKWGWPVIKFQPYKQDLPKNFKKGIIYAKAVPISDCQVLAAFGIISEAGDHSG